MSAKSKGTRYPELVQFLAPKGTNAALDRLASAKLQTKSELIRQALRGDLVEAGVRLTAEPVAA